MRGQVVVLLGLLVCWCAADFGRYDEDGTRVVRQHGRLSGLQKLSSDDFQNDPLNKVLLSSSNIGLLKPDDGPISNSRGAWLTHLTNDYFIPGARALGHSIKRTNSRYPLVLLYTDGLTEEGLNILRDDGVWQLKHVSNLKNPNADHYMFQSRLANVYTKCHIYNQTEWDKIVYIDSDIIFLENSDELFNCPGYCASFRHSFFNTGVIVAQPNTKFFNDLIEKFPTLPSYNGGEQGLMNAYFWDFDIKCPLFHDDAQTINNFRQNRVNCGRLPSYYNGDIGPYYLHDASWLLPEQKNAPKILHYTLGAFKPWEWLWYPVFDICWLWYEMYTDIPGVPASVSEQIFNIWVFFGAFFPISLVGLLFIDKVRNPVRSTVDSILEFNAKTLLHSETIVQIISGYLAQQSNVVLISTASVLLTAANIGCYILFSIKFVYYIAGSEVLHPGLCLFIAVEWLILNVSIFSYCYYRSMFLMGCRLSAVLPKQRQSTLQSEEWKKTLRNTFITLFLLFAAVSFLATYSIHPDWYTLSSKIHTAIVIIVIGVYLVSVMSLHLPFDWLRVGISQK